MTEATTISGIIEEVIPRYQKRAKKKKAGSVDSVPEAEYTIIYDSTSESLEPVYFFILDLMNDFGLAPEKLIDNFTASPGSGHFGDIGQRATIMQQQGAKLLGDMNAVLRSILNIIYDLKDFKMRIQHYKDLKTDKKEAASLSLKQIWLDKVDITKGNSSIKAMAFAQGGAGRTLLDAFLMANSQEDIKKLDLNDVVKRILIPRVEEFKIWLKQSEKELQNRYNIEKTYLKSQVNSLKLYSRWAKPYLKAARKLEMNDGGRNPALVNTFNTTILELTLFGKHKLKVKESALEGKLPDEFAKEKFIKTLKRNYHSCILVDFSFRGIPRKISQRGDYAFGGRAEVTFRAYALNDDELAKLEEEFKKSEVEDVLRLIEGSTTESLEKLQEDINFFLEEKEEEEKQKKPKDESNPFMALLGFYDKKEKPKEKKKKLTMSPDNFIESEHLRPLVVNSSTETAFTLFDIYKKAHDMASYT
jgi:hypothetical protein